MKSGAGLKIMVVDDEPDECYLWKRTLQKRYGKEVKVETYTDPQTALAHLKPEISFLLIDWQMPRLDGSQFLKNAREKGIDTRRIVIMSNTTADRLHENFELGECLAVIQKGEPAQQEALLKILDELTGTQN